MKRFHLVMVAVDLLVAGINVHNYLTPPNHSPFSIAGAVLGVCCAAWHTWHYQNINRKEAADGRHRQAEEGPRDPGDGTGAEGATSGGPFTWTASTVTLGSGLTPAQVRANLVKTLAEAEATAVERVEGDQPILAHRLAYLVFDGTSKPWRSLNAGIRFGADATAECAKWSSRLRYSYVEREALHSAPGVGCTCGFYALPADVEAWAEGNAYVTLLVELMGTVVEHERGYRASHQRIVECQFSCCPLCGGESSVINVDDEGTFLAATCRTHRLRGARHMTSEDAARVLGVPITFTKEVA